MTQPPRPLTDIERAVSRERLKRYLAATSQSLSDAIFLYERNIALSETTYGLLHGLEVAIRNSMHDALSSRFQTSRWYDVAPLTPYSRDKVNAAVRDAGGTNASPGKVVAELTFGFWTDLAARGYHWTLWQPCLSAAFPYGRLARPIIHRRLEDLRYLRNRIAHHEPILTSARALYVGGGRTISLASVPECGRWISPSIGDWLRTEFRLSTAETILETVAKSGWNL